MSNLIQQEQLAIFPFSPNEESFSVLLQPLNLLQFEDYIKHISPIDRDRLFRAAVFNGHIHILDHFLRLTGSNTIGINGRLADGYTPLQWAAEMGMVHMTRYLLRNGADPYSRIGINLSAYELAKEGPTREYMERFIAASAIRNQPHVVVHCTPKEQRG